MKRDNMKDEKEIGKVERKFGQMLAYSVATGIAVLAMGIPAAFIWALFRFVSGDM